MLRRFSIIYSAARILRNLEIYPNLRLSYSRPFSCRSPVDNQQGKDDIANWVKSSLHEPIPSQHFPRTVRSHVPTSSGSPEFCPTRFIVSEEEYWDEWYLGFKLGDLNVVGLVLKKALKEKTLFKFAHIVTLLKSLKYLRRNHDAHEIFCAYKDYLAYLRQDGDDEAYCDFLEVSLRVESTLSNYKICEELFSEYIKFPNLKAELITVGLRSFLENNNLQLAREFYIQALNNPDTFPMSSKELTELLRDLSRHGDCRSIQTFFDLWLKKKCTEGPESTKYYPSYSLLSLIHRMYLRRNDENGLMHVLSREVVQKTGYQDDVLFELNEFFHILHCQGFILQSDMEAKIHYFITRLRFRKERREEFYLFLLNSFVLSKDFTNLKYVLCLIQKDSDIELKPKFHLAIARYFVNQGMLHNLVEYYSDILKRGGPESLQLRVSVIDQLYRCASYAHPALTREIVNEFKVILNKDLYIPEFPQLRDFLKKLSRIQIKKGGNGSDEFGMINMSQIDYERLEIFQRFVSRRDLVGARLYILENLRRGTQPSLNFHYCILQKCLDLQLPSLGKTLDDLFSSTYQEIPVKLKILWLRYDISNQYNSLLTHAEPFSVSKVKVLVSRLQDFERHHQSVLNFRNYMQLTQISLLIREYATAESLLQRAVSLMDERDKQQWQIYYMTSLKLAARVYDMDMFLRLIDEWVGNSKASWITHDCLRQVKSFVKLFAKRGDCIPNYDENLRLEIVSACERLVQKYTDLKFEGLDSMHALSKFLKDWLDMEMRYRAKLLRSRRAELEKQLSEENATTDCVKLNNVM